VDGRKGQGFALSRTLSEAAPALLGSDLLPLLLVQVRLRFTAPVRFHFLHGGALHGLLCGALGHELPEGLVPFATESGRVRFDAGDLYHFGLTLCGEARSLASRLEGGLVAPLGRLGSAPRASGPPVTLGGNFTVETVAVVAEITAEKVAGLAAAASERESLTLRFLSPLRLERPAALAADGARFFNSDCFPAGVFLHRLGQRLTRLATGSYAAPGELPPLPPEAIAVPGPFTWIDLPLTGKVEARQGRQTRMTLGGGTGAVLLAGLSPVWLEPLVLGRFLHAGQSTRYGLGRFALEDVSPAAADPFQPARSYLAEAASPAALAAALEHLLDRRVFTDAPDPEGLTPEELATAGDPAMESLGYELRTGTYRPPPLSGFLLRRDDGRLRPLAVPPVRDRIAQRAAAQALTPAIETLLEDCSYAYRKGFSRAGAARAIQRAWDDGFRVVLDADIAAFFDSVDLDRLLARLRALFPFEPLVELIAAWLAVPVLFEGERLVRRRGLPQGAPLSPLLAHLYLDELDEEVLGQDFRLVRFADDFVVLCRSVEEAVRARAVARKMPPLGPVPRATLSASAWLAHVPFEFLRGFAERPLFPGRPPRLQRIG
jgi:hypothetical protein